MKNRIDLTKFNIRTDLVIDHKIEKDYITSNQINDSIKLPHFPERYKSELAPVHLFASAKAREVNREKTHTRPALFVLLHGYLAWLNDLFC